ncbi:MAG: AAA family ATPase [Candidatus Levybacteria bacterium]|nr:AAA family ATPase [Candidatus Levybacteria bacterium]
MTKEKLSPSGEFSVIVENVPTMHRWLQVQDKIARSHIAHVDDASLELAFLYIEDGVLRDIRSSLAYNTDDNSYAFKTLFTLPLLNPPLTDNGNDDISTAPFQGNDLQENLSAILSRIIANPTSPKPFNLNQLSMHLQKSLGEQKYEVLAYDDRLVLEIIRKANSEDSIPEAIYEFHPLMSPGYCLHTEDAPTVPSLEEFERDIHDYTELTKHLTDAIYRLKDRPPLDATCVLTPPRSTDNNLEQLEKAYEMRRRMLSAEGILDDESLEEEIMRRVMLESRPDISFVDIIGQEKAKEELESIVYSLVNPEAFTEEGTYPPRGVILYGEPGNGKTLLAKAVAHEANATFLNVQLSDIVHPLYGKSEKFIAKLFARAAQEDAAVIFFDEFDEVAPHREGAHAPARGIVTTILTNLDGLEERGGNIVVMAATNRLEAIDRPMIRPGRFDMLIEVTKPTPEERRQTFQLYIEDAQQRAQDIRPGKMLFDPSINLATLAKNTEGMNYADIEELIRRVLNVNVKMRQRGEIPGLVTTERIMEQIAAYESIRKAKSGIGEAIFGRSTNR